MNFILLYQKIMFPAIRQREIRLTKEQMSFGIRTGIKRNFEFFGKTEPIMKGDFCLFLTVKKANLTFTYKGKCYIIKR